jgi:hypothetical protein
MVVGWDYHSRLGANKTLPMRCFSQMDDRMSDLLTTKNITAAFTQLAEQITFECVIEHISCQIFPDIL